MARSVLPHQRLLELDQRLQHAAARPVIVPETIVCDYADPPVMPMAEQQPWSRACQGGC
jgi:hypothetical protein